MRTPQRPLDEQRDGEPTRRVTRTTTFFVVLAAASAAALAWRDGGAELLDALRTAGVLFVSIAPVILAALLLGGVVTPAGPFAVFPILVGLRSAGAGLAVCVVYVTSWATLGLQRMIVWELPFLGFDFVGLRIAASLPVPILAGLLAAAVARRVRT